MIREMDSLFELLASGKVPAPENINQESAVYGL